jgi:hypothetical protein
MKQIVEALVKLWFFQCGLDLLSRKSLQNDPRILRGLPEFWIKAFPQFVGSMVPGPVEV